MRECKTEFNGQLNRYPINFQERFGFPLNKLKDRLSEIQWLCAKGRVKRIFYKDLEEVGFDLTKKAKRKAEEAGGANSSVTDGGGHTQQEKQKRHPNRAGCGNRKERGRPPENERGSHRAGPGRDRADDGGNQAGDGGKTPQRDSQGKNRNGSTYPRAPEADRNPEGNEHITPKN
jgi:hypothetical protein